MLPKPSQFWIFRQKFLIELTWIDWMDWTQFESPKTRFFGISVQCSWLDLREKSGEECKPTFLAKIWDPPEEKKDLTISRLLRKCPCPKLQNELRLDSLELPSPTPFMTSLWLGSGEGLTIKGFGDRRSRLSSGGSFRSSGQGRSRSSLEINWIFFSHFNFPGSAVVRIFP